MSTTMHTTAHAPVHLNRQDIPQRWEAALKRAQDAGVTVYALGRGRWAVTSAHATGKAYEVTTIPETCTCPAAQRGDPVCLHRAIVREHLRPQPEPPAAYDHVAEALQWAYNDRDRAYRDLERYNARIERGDVLNDREWAGFLNAQERELDAHDRIVALKARQTATAA